MNTTIINGIVYESDSPMSIINNVVVSDGEVFVNGKSLNKNNSSEELPIITKNYDIENIKAVYNGLFSIEVNVNPHIEKEELIVIATEATHKNMSIKFNRSNLLIDGNGGGFGIIKIRLNAKNLDKIVNSGIGNIGGSINVQKLNIQNDATGNIKLEGTVDTLQLENSGVGNLNTLDLLANKVSFSNSGVGNLKCTSHVIEHGSMSGVGNVKYHADQESRISKSGIGNVKYLGSKDFLIDNNETTMLNLINKKDNKNESILHIITNPNSPVKKDDNEVSLTNIINNIRNNNYIKEKDTPIAEKEQPSSLPTKFKKLL